MQSLADGEPGGKIAYILKGYPRLSEIFIASEILRVEEAGVPIEIFVIKSPDESVVHDVVKRIRARPHYLCQLESVSGVRFRTWIGRNFPVVIPSLLHAIKHHPAGLLRASFTALAQAVRARRSFWVPPRKVYMKELFQALLLVHEVSRIKSVRHLHAHFCHGSTTVSWLASIMTGMSFSFTAHAKDIYAERLNPVGLLGRKLSAARFAVTCTNANRDHLTGLCRNARIYRIYHGLNVDFEQLIKKSPRSRPRMKELGIIAVGRLVRKKGFDVLADACGQLAEAGVPFHVSIFGQEGEAKAEIESRIRAHGIENRFVLEGPVLQEGLYHAMRHATVMALPCRVLEDGDRDGIPNVLVEAMASGLPVVTTPISGIPELVTDQVNGLFVPPDDAAALAKMLMRIHMEPDLGARLSAEAFATVATRFDAGRETKKLISHLRSAL